MIIYIKLGKVRALAIEINKELGLKPLCNKNSFRHEVVIDIPYTQIVYTSGRWCRKKRVAIRSIANGNEETNQTSKNLKRIHRN